MSSVLCSHKFDNSPFPNETAIPNHPGVVYQRFERGVACFDPNGVVDNPPGAGQVYLLHLDKGPGQDPRIAQLQAEIATLTQPAQLLQQISTALASASSGLAQAGTAVAEAVKLSTLQ